jgi:hypothetical protein
MFLKRLIIAVLSIFYFTLSEFFNVEKQGFLALSTCYRGIFSSDSPRRTEKSKSYKQYIVNPVFLFIYIYIYIYIFFF